MIGPVKGAGDRRVLCLVPAHDEEATIGLTVKSLSRVQAISEIVVVADGCTDRTAAEASAAGARVLTGRRRVGKGRALDAAIDRVDRPHTFVLVDADTGDTASEVSLLLGPVLRGDLDLAIGHLPALGGGGFGWVKATAGRFIRLASGFRALEPLSGQRAITAEALFACRPLAGGFGLETAMTIDAVRLGFRVGERAVRMAHRATGRSLAGFVHRGLQGLDIAAAATPRLLGFR